MDMSVLGAVKRKAGALLGRGHLKGLFKTRFFLFTALIGLASLCES